MNEILIPSLYLLAGYLIYASTHHFSVSLSSHHDSMHLLFGSICLLAVPFAIFHAQMLQATNVVEFVRTLRWSLAAALLLLLLLPWFIALYTGKRPWFLLVGLSILFAILFMVNLTQPNSIQYDHIDGIHTLMLPWGETVTRGDGHPGFWVYITVAGVSMVFIFTIYSLIDKYLRSRQRSDVYMLFSIGLFLLASTIGILARLSIINFVEPGPVGILAMVIVMSIALSKETQQRLRTSERHFRALFDNSPTGMVAVDPESRRVVQANQMALKMSGFSAEEILTKTVIDLTHPDDMDLEEQHKHFEILARGLVSHLNYEKRYIRKDGSSFIGDSSISILKDDSGKVLHFIASTIDITGRKQTEVSLRESETRFRSVIEQSPIGMAFGRDGVTVEVNEVYLHMFGYDDMAQVCGQPLISQIAPQCRPEIEDRIRRRSRGETVETTYETVGLRKDGSQFPIYISAKRLVLNDGPLTFAFLIDITQRKKSEEEIKHLAFYDQLTNLPNRRLLLDRIQQSLTSSARNGRYGALLLIDLDDFKTLNDTHGHIMGDSLLQQISKRLEDCVREGDTLARLGGDEFVVLLEDLSEEPLEAAAYAKGIGNKIHAALNQPYQLILNKHYCTVSIGATLYQGLHSTKDELIKQADIAMYQAKKAGRNTLILFNSQMQESINNRAALEIELRLAIEKQQFQLYYQTQVDSTGRSFGAEALIRWIHPERGMVSPAHFIPLAEESGLILPIGKWVLETACNQIKLWEQHVHTRDLVLSVNVSAKQFRQTDFVVQVQTAIRIHAINPTRLKLELTESMLVEDVEDTIATMNALSEIGVQFSLDDFGTGYSSLQYLKRLPLDQLKIDQSFVRDLAVDISDKAIVRTIIVMAQSLNLNVIAEGVETEEQRNLLMSKECKYFQGYLFGKPVPIEQFEVLLVPD
jgi:diguanylate cyclase (GGDEF)-like protein/PAS domain S-box-containing protein